MGDAFRRQPLRWPRFATRGARWAGVGAPPDKRIPTDNDACSGSCGRGGSGGTSLTCRQAGGPRRLRTTARGSRPFADGGRRDGMNEGVALVGASAGHPGCARRRDLARVVGRAWAAVREA